MLVAKWRMAKLSLRTTKLLRVTLVFVVQLSGRVSLLASSSNPGFARRFATGIVALTVADGADSTADVFTAVTR